MQNLIRHPSPVTAGSDLLLELSSDGDNTTNWLIPVHKKFLISQIPYFEGMFNSEGVWRETKNCQVIEGVTKIKLATIFNVSKNTVLKLLEFIYARSIYDRCYSKCDAKNYITHDNVIEFIELSEVWIIPEIQQFAIDYAEKYMDSEMMMKAFNCDNPFVKEKIEPICRKFVQMSAATAVPKIEIPKAAASIIQICKVVLEYDKPTIFTKFMERAYQGQVSKAIVFTDTKRSCDYLAQELGSRGWPVDSIHGDKDQRQRDQTLKEFRTGNIPILIATNVAILGLDFYDVQFVINYDFPNNFADYIQRIGLMERSKTPGIACSLLTVDKAKHVNKLIEFMKKTGQEVTQEVRDLVGFN